MPESTYSQVACIGCGLSAVALGSSFKRWYGITDVQFFDRQSDVGGVWFANSYPGCASDVPSALYCLSFAPNKQWSSLLESRDKLHNYITQVANTYGLLERMKFGAKVKRCQWIDDRQRWRLQIQDETNNELLVHECQLLFSAVGQLVYPRKPDVAGLESFRGPIFHASQWRHDVNLQDKNVVVLGHGCTAIQVVPAIREHVRHLTQFIRSGHWIIRPFQAPAWLTSLAQLACRNIPGFFSLLRFASFLATEVDMSYVYMNSFGGMARRFMARASERFIRSTAPETYHDMLIPDFEYGCKRVVTDDAGYLKGLHANNLTLTDESIIEVLPDGVKSKTGFTKADVIILATGYETNEYLAGIEIIGRNGKTIAQHWDSSDGPTAYNSVFVNGFPNFFMIFGPNTGASATSSLIPIENTVNYSLRVCKPLIDGFAATVEVKAEAEQRYQQNIDHSLQNRVWASGCASWFVRGQSRNAAIYPFTQLYFWYKCLFPKYNDFLYT